MSDDEYETNKKNDCKCPICIVNCKHEIFYEPSYIVCKEITDEINQGYNYKFSYKEDRPLNPCLSELLERVYYIKNRELYTQCPSCIIKIKQLEI